MGCPCNKNKKCAHMSGKGKCPCKAAGQECCEECSCSPRSCTNRVSTVCFDVLISFNSMKIMD